MTLIRLCLAFVFLANLGMAQDLPSPVLTVDLERIARESDYGQRMAAELQADTVILQSEFNRIEAELIAEEQSLVIKRDTLSSDEFKKLSQAFDEKVVSLRAEQAEKQTTLQARQVDEQREILQRIAPILYEIVSARGGAALIDRRNIVLDLSSVDITDRAIELMNQRLGDGTHPAEASSGQAPHEGLSCPIANSLLGDRSKLRIRTPND